MRVWERTVINKHGWETTLRVIHYQEGPLEGAVEIELGQQQGRDYPRGGLMSPSDGNDLRDWLVQGA